MRNGELLSTFVLPGGGQRRFLLERDMPIVMSASRGHLSVDAYFVSCITLMCGWQTGHSEWIAVLCNVENVSVIENVSMCDVLFHYKLFASE